VDGILDDLETRFPGSIQIAHRNNDGVVRYVCLVHDGHMPALDNAKFIVRACNSTEELIQDVEEVISILSTSILKAKQ
jgi:hypothetical protein